jgi:hypothetical protein
MRRKNIRSVPSRWARVEPVTLGRFCPGRSASHGLKSSICRRETAPMLVVAGARSVRNAANDRSA